MVKAFSPEERQAWLRSLPGNPASASLILENSARELLVVKSGYKKHWSLPGGVVDEKESPLEAVIREAKEEIGLTIGPNKIQFIKVFFRSSPDQDRYKFVFKATISHDMIKAIVLQPSEIDEFDFVTKERVIEGDREYTTEIIQWANGDESYYVEEKVSH